MFPQQVVAYIKGKTIVSVKIEDKWEGDSKEIYGALGEFISENQTRKRFIINSRRTTGEKKFDIDKFTLVPDFMKGVFFYKGRPFFFNSEKATEHGSVPASIEISTIGRDPCIIYEAAQLVERMNLRPSERYYYEANKSEWEAVGVIRKAPAIFLTKEVKEKLDKKIDFYINSKQHCLDKGHVHKLLIIVYGPPGTGKSRISRYVADRLNASLASMTSGAGFTDLMRAAAKKNIVVSVPDFDTMDLAASRGDLDKNNKDDDQKESQADKLARHMMSSGLSTILNLFQGDIPADDLVAVMSTNCIDDIDPALLRAGRCDLLLEVGYLTYDEVNAYQKFHYDSQEDLPEVFKSIQIKACDMTAAYDNNVEDRDGYIRDIAKLLTKS